MTELPPSGVDPVPSFDLDNLLTDMRSRLDPELPPQERMHALLQAVLTIGEDLDLPTVLRAKLGDAVLARRVVDSGVYTGARLRQFTDVLER